MKRMTTLLLALALCAALCGCWAQQPSVPGQPEGTTTPEVGQAAPQSSAAPSAAATATPDSRLIQSKTYQYFSARTSGDYTMTLRTQTVAGTRTTTTAVVSGRTVYSDITTDTGRFTNFEKDGKNYTADISGHRRRQRNAGGRRQERALRRRATRRANGGRNGKH